MIDKDYFKRQATTLRKMVEVAQDKAVAERLVHLANDFEAKADESGAPSDSRNTSDDRPPATSRDEGNGGR